jgi:hypothetical protein
MANEGLLELTLLDVSGSPARDPGTRLTVRRGNGDGVVRVFQTSFPPTRNFALPAFPDEHVLAPFIEPTRYRAKPVTVFSLTHGKTVTRNITVFRKPSEWEPRFTKWNALSDDFAPLKKALEASRAIKVRGGASLEVFTGSAYDKAVAEDARVLLPKTCFLNLFGKLMALREPVKKHKEWFKFVQRILEIGRERFIAVVEPEMAARIREVRENLDDYSEVYKATPAANHYANMPKAFAVVKSSMVSIKTTDDNGNVQLTVGRGTDPDTGQEAWLLDTDIDENGKLLAHLGDLFKHKFTGGTHPIDIHEYLTLAHPGIDLGYTLV